MIIAEHCREDGWRGRKNPYIPACAWPEKAYVQWGGNGIVFDLPNSYRTAFFEAFIDMPDLNKNSFFRGEGEDVAAAEADCFKSFERAITCGDHEWTKGSYRNGAGYCKKCRLFQGRLFQPSEQCCKCGVSTYWTQDKDNDWWCETCTKDMPREKWSWLNYHARGEEPPEGLP